MNMPPCLVGACTGRIDAAGEQSAVHGVGCCRAGRSRNRKVIYPRRGGAARITRVVNHFGARVPQPMFQADRRESYGPALTRSTDAPPGTRRMSR